MKPTISKSSSYIFAVVMLMLATSCKKDYTDPSKAPEGQVFTNAAAMTAVSAGLQRTYSLTRASALYNIITTTGLVTHELNLLNAGNLPEFQLSAGSAAVDGTNTILAGLWTTCNKIVYDANNVIQGSAVLPDKGYVSGLIGYSTIFKVLSIGALSMYWEKIPANIGTNVSFINRADGFNKAVSAIDSALALINANAISSSFTGNIPAGIDIVSTLQALKARYSLYAGNYTQALAAANAVDLTKKSTFNFEAGNPNPIYDVAGSNYNVYQPVDSTMGLPVDLRPDLSDKRVAFYMALSVSPASRFQMKGFSSSSTTAFPVYLPGEITLIKAECYARQSTPDLTNALSELNRIVTKQPAADPFGVGAGLASITGPQTQAQLLNLIYVNRCIELYMSGLKLEDMRRFGRPNTERTRNLMPYPFRERDNNPNTPNDPLF